MAMRERSHMPVLYADARRIGYFRIKYQENSQINLRETARKSIFSQTTIKKEDRWLIGGTKAEKQK